MNKDETVREMALRAEQDARMLGLIARINPLLQEICQPNAEGGYEFVFLVLPNVGGHMACSVSREKHERIYPIFEEMLKAAIVEVRKPTSLCTWPAELGGGVMRLNDEQG